MAACRTLTMRANTGSFMVMISATMDDMELPDRSLRLFMTAWLEGVSDGDAWVWCWHRCIVTAKVHQIKIYASVLHGAKQAPRHAFTSPADLTRTSHPRRGIQSATSYRGNVWHGPELHPCTQTPFPRTMNSLRYTIVRHSLLTKH